MRIDPERCTVYAVSSAQVSSSCVRAFSSSDTNLHFVFVFFQVYVNVDYFKLLLTRTIYFEVVDN